MSSREQPESAEQTLIVEPDEQTTNDSSAANQPTVGPRARALRELRRGDAVGRYVILERVGAGGMGVVYAAWDPKLDRKVALKLLHGDKADHHGQRLEREAQAMARLTHPNVIAVHDVGEVEGRVFVAMEFVEGETLGGWARLDRSGADEPEPRGWSEVLEVMLAAGRGLAAAHAQGLIHRDFKPDNVMIGADGRVRVMDFGLVRATLPSATGGGPAAGDEGREAGPRSGLRTEALEDLALESASVLESHLTQAGALLGTPAYMAPEQLRGEEADARADQFSFCIALWQCLYGVRPFVGDSPLAVLFAIAHGHFRDPPPGRAVPSWVRRALERGLASDPAARWPDMPSLLAALADDPKAKRRPWVLGGASLGLAAAAAVAAIALQAPPEPAPCEQAGHELRERWSDARRAELEAAFTASELTYASQTWERVGLRLDDWAQQWIGARKAACEDTHVRSQQSAELLDLRMACLDQRLDRFSALVELFATADDTVIEKAVEAVEALPQLEICSDRSWLTATVRPPEDPQLAAALAELREDIARVGAMTDAGKAADAVALAEQLQGRVSELGWAPVVAEADLHLGRARQELGQFAEARAALERSYFASRQAGHDEVTVEAAFLLIYGLSVGLGEFDAAAGWIDHALAEAERIGRNDLLAEVYGSVGIHHYVKGESKAAATAFARSLELHSSANSVGLGAAHINYGTILSRVDPSARERAFAELARGLRMLEDRLGDQHPNFASALSNYATVHGVFGQHREAIELLERALEIDERVYGLEHPMTALVQLNLANNLVELEQPHLSRALELAQQALVTHRDVVGAQHSMVAQSERTIAKILLRLERPDEAIVHADAALQLWTTSFGEDHPDTDLARLERARCERALGRSDDARAGLELILSHYLDPQAPDAKTLAGAQLELAELLTGEDPERAASLIAKAKPHFKQTGDHRNLRRVLALEHALGHRETDER
ncbi:MAG: serine/threonine-protein kinase [Enhygromyxa sp.]